MHRIDWLHDQWSQQADALGIDLEEMKTGWDTFSSAYQETHRVYHNFTHIQALLEQAADCRSLMQDPQAVIIAIWFHDLVYDPFRKDNEEKSAERARHMLQRWNQSPAFVTTVVQLIEDTAQHKPSNQSGDTFLFLDMDLSILGSDPEDYKAYCAAIREEYKQVPDEMYRAGREQILRRFLERPQLYVSQKFQAQFEAQARENIAQELLMLTTHVP